MDKMDLIAMFEQAEQTKKYSKGTFIFHQGEPSGFMYVILEGEVDIILNDKVIATFKPGHIFGEMALIDEGPRSASAFAKTDCKVVYIDRDNFLYLIQNTPYFALHVMKILTMKVRELDKLLVPES
ncbi:MAG: cyclic nucleotide-binding domain-containing protein [Candidatus Dadabacteria bacterium]|nr:cyclic nucleotide-binding domain-containing protein [Candidatus Dadabacteria bacterium]